MSPAELERPLPQPVTPEAKPYWDGLREQKLMLPKCQDCGHCFFYPRILCPRCSSRRIGWIQSSGRGRLFSFKVKPPYVLAMVELEEGPRLMSNLVGIAADPALIRCDMPVEVVYEKLNDEFTLPLFRPRAGAAGGRA